MAVLLATGDVRTVLRVMDSNSGDAGLSDTPYGKRILNHRWDYAVPSVDVWQEMCRVLKPGAPLLAFGGRDTHHRLMCNIEDAGFELCDCLMWLHGNGYGTRLKPAWEPVILAHKPRDGTYANNISTWGVGGLNIANCMLPGRDKAKFPVGDYANPGMYGVGGHREGDANPDARFPANVLLTHHPECEEVADGCHPDCPIHLLDEQAGQEASRFYYCGRASGKERHQGLDGEKIGHPCVKPLQLCEYLARLILPPDQGSPRTILVPYAGSGSEMIGAMRAGWDDVRGIEIDRHYVEIAKKRIRYWRENG